MEHILIRALKNSQWSTYKYSVKYSGKYHVIIDLKCSNKI